jgi:hypothetical protein
MVVLNFCLKIAPPVNFLPFLYLLCTLVFIGEVWLDHKHIGPSTLFLFLYFKFFYFLYFFLKRAISTSAQQGKISDYKINALKVERVHNTFEKFKFF